MGYDEIKKIYNRERLDIFVMAITHLMNIGWETAEQISDLQIAVTEGNGLMTKEFCQNLNRLTREIALCCQPHELVQLCEAEEIFDIQFKPNKVSRNKLESALVEAINQKLYHENISLEDVAEEFGLDLEDLEKLDYEINWEE